MDVKALRKRLNESGYKLRHVAGQIGLTYMGFLYKLRGERDFKLAEVQKLVEFLGLTEDEKQAIFFAPYARCKRAKSVAESAPPPSDQPVAPEEPPEAPSAPAPPKPKKSPVAPSPWKSDFSVYLAGATEVYEALRSDAAWLAEQQKYLPSYVDVPLTLEKVFKRFWGTEEGWAHKKRQKTNAINWRVTFAKSVEAKYNWVYKERSWGETEARRVERPETPEERAVRRRQQIIDGVGREKARGTFRAEMLDGLKEEIEELGLAEELGLTEGTWE